MDSKVEWGSTSPCIWRHAEEQTAENKILQSAIDKMAATTGRRWEKRMYDALMYGSSVYCSTVEQADVPKTIKIRRFGYYEVDRKDRDWYVAEIEHWKQRCEELEIELELALSPPFEGWVDPDEIKPKRRGNY